MLSPTPPLRCPPSQVINADLINSDDINTGRITVDSIVRIDNSQITSLSGNLEINAASQVAIQTNTTVVGVLSVTDDITAFWSSDSRLKDNVLPIEDALAKVISISGNTFDWNQNSNKSGHDVGVIAQDVEQAFIDEGLDPRRYSMFCEDEMDDGTMLLGVRYAELLAFVIAAL